MKFEISLGGGKLPGMPNVETVVCARRRAFALDRSKLFLFVSLRPDWPFIFFRLRERCKLPDFRRQTQRNRLIDNRIFFSEPWIGDAGFSLSDQQLQRRAIQLAGVARTQKPTVAPNGFQDFAFPEAVSFDRLIVGQIGGQARAS